MLLQSGDRSTPRPPLLRRTRVAIPGSKGWKIVACCLASPSSPFPPPTPVPRRSRRAPTATSGSPRAAGDKIGMINPTTHAITEFPVPTASSDPDRDHSGPRRQPLVHRDCERQQDRDDQPDDPRHHRVPHSHRRFRPLGDHGGPRRQPLVHRERRRQDRDDQPDDPRHHRVPRPHRQLPIPTGSRRAPTATSGSPSIDGNQIGMINPTTHAITEFPIPTASSGPEGITAGPDGNLWFTENMRQPDRDDQPDDPRHHRVRRPHRRCQSYGITAGPDGNLWFTESARQDRDDQPDDPRHHRVPRSLRQFRIPTGSRRAPTATSGSPIRDQRDRRRHPEHRRTSW